MRFGKLIEEACDRQGISYRELSRALGRTQPWGLHVLKSTNLTERVFKECARVLDLEVQVKLVPKAKAAKRMAAKQVMRQAKRTQKLGRPRSSDA